MKIGDTVFYKSLENVIEDIDGNIAKIQNPIWESDEDDENIPFWCWVPISELEIKK